MFNWKKKKSIYVMQYYFVLLEEIPISEAHPVKVQAFFGET